MSFYGIIKIDDLVSRYDFKYVPHIFWPFTLSLWNSCIISSVLRWWIWKVWILKIRLLIALSQVFFGLGLLLDFRKIKLTEISSGLLSIMMAGAIITRIIIKDELIQSLPALGYLLINSFIFIKSIQKWKSLNTF